MRDTVEYDLIVVMDGYDRQEVVREVAVLERLRPGGGYLTRVQRLNSFARAGHLVLKDRCLLVRGRGWVWWAWGEGTARLLRGRWMDGWHGYLDPPACARPPPHPRATQVPEDVPDPLYGVVSAAVEQAALRRAVHSIALGCRGLLAYLLKLRAKWVWGLGVGPALLMRANEGRKPGLHSGERTS